MLSILSLNLFKIVYMHIEKYFQKVFLFGSFKVMRQNTIFKLSII